MEEPAQQPTYQLVFAEFCNRCEKISFMDKEKREGALRKYIDLYKQKYNDNFYRILRFLLPNLDRERGPYGIKENTLARLYIRILCLDKQCSDARRLLNYRASVSAFDSGDFADVAHIVISSRCTASKMLSVDSIHRYLDNIAMKHAEHDIRGIENILTMIVKQMSPLEQKWFIRIILKDVKIGLGVQKILSVFHPDAKELYDVTNSLSKVCETLKDPNLRLYEIEINLFSPFRPMLAERCDVQNVEQHFKKIPGKKYVEQKLDGERSQVHYDKGKFMYISRNGFNFTEYFGGDATSGSFSPHLIKQIKPNIENCILDGEMMPWNTNFKRFGNKGMNIDVKYLRIGNAHQPCLCVFDVLYCNGQVLTNKPLEARLQVLDQIFTPLDGIVMHTRRREVNSSEEVLACLNEAIDNREEGIVLKDPNSIYKPNSRKDGWVKIKPEYTPGAMVELDLLIIGGYYGEGRKRGIISHFLMGLAVPSSTEGEEPAEFVSLSRVGSGCTMEELAELGKKLEPFWKKLKPGECPNGLKWTKEKPELWIEPRKSVILQVKASELVRSSEYHTGYTLRFPTIEKVRYDKPWYDCLTTEQLFKLYMETSGKLCSSHIEQQNLPKARKKKAPAITKAVGDQWCNFELNDVKRVTKLFSNKEICVLTGYKDMSKQSIEIKIAENGGDVVQNPGPNTFCVVATNPDSIRVKNVCTLGMHDVVKTEWLLDCLDADELIPWHPRDLISKSQATVDKMSLEYDEFGDSYTEPATLESLKWSLQKASELGNSQPLTQQEMAEVDDMLFKGPSPFAIFRLCVAYFDTYAKVGEPNSVTDKFAPLNITKLKYELQGGIAADQLTTSTTHVIVHLNDKTRLEEIKAIKERENLNFSIVNHSWVEDSYEQSSKLEESRYLLL